ncbi:MAG: sugar transferase [Nanoarchaeota archaeon]
MLALNASFALAVFARSKLLGPTDFFSFAEILQFSTVTLVLLLFSFNQYAQKRGLFDVDEFIAVTKAAAFTGLIAVSFAYLSKSGIQYSRFVTVLSFALATALIAASRYFLRRLLGYLRSKGFDAKKVYVFSDSNVSKLVYRKIKEHPELGYALVDSFDKCQTAFISPQSQKDLLNLVFSHPNIEFKIIPDVVQTVTEPARFDEFPDIPLVTLERRSSMSGYLVWKRAFDFAVSFSLIIVTSPFLLLIGFANLLLYRKMFFVQKRLGLGLKEFKMYKFPSMKPWAGEKPESEADYLFKVGKDPRVTTFGRILRRTCLDELPQLFNILKGEMSLVGPRPHLKEELRFFQGWKLRRFSVRPGMTGLWQVSGRHELNSDKAASLDLYYVNHMSFSLDLKILLKTVPAIIFSRGRW